MKFYAYKGREPLGKESPGSIGKLLFELKTVAGAHRRVRRVLGPQYRLYRYTNFHNDSTFREV